MNMCKRWKQTLSGAALYAIATSAAYAGDADAPAQAEELPPGITRLRDHGALVIETGKEAGVRSWVAIGKAGNVQIFHTTPEGGLIAGLLFDEAGRNISKRQIEDLKREKLPDQVRAALGLDTTEAHSASSTGTPHVDAQFVGILQDLAWVPLGTGVPVYLFADLNCGHCHELWTKLAPAVRAARIQLRVIPIVIRPEPSRLRAHALLGLQRADATPETFDQVLAQTVFETTLPSDVAKMDSVLDMNLAAFRLLRVDGTPTIVYVDPASGGGIKVIYAPQDDEVARLLANIPEGK